jgi:hypothetical protein
LALEESPAEFSAMMDENLLSYVENFLISRREFKIRLKVQGLRGALYCRENPRIPIPHSSFSPFLLT